MPKAKSKSGIDFDGIEKWMRENPTDFFSDEETARRAKECMRRMGGLPRAMNMITGQNLQPPFLSDEELKRRGYPCDPGFE